MGPIVACFPRPNPRRTSRLPIAAGAFADSLVMLHIHNVEILLFRFGSDMKEEASAMLYFEG